MSLFSQLIAKSQESLGLDPEELQKLLDYIVCSKVDVSEQVRVLAMAVGNTLLGSTLNLAKRFPLHIAIQHGRSELIPLLLDVYGPFIHAKCDGRTAAHIAAYRMEIASLVHLYRHDSAVLYDVDDYGFTPFRILYREFLRVAFGDCQFNGDYPAHVFAFGENPVSNLGILSGKRAPYPTIVELPREYNQVGQVSLGRFHSLFLVNGKVFVCGMGRDARLGLGDESDFALPRLVDIQEEVVCIAAGLSHSIACSAKKIFVFGSNAKGQLGIPRKDIITLPVMALKLKNTDDYFVRCVACESYSAAYTKDGKWYVSGSNIPWRSGETILQFTYCPELHYRDAVMSDLAAVFGAWGGSSKLSVCSHGTLIDSHLFEIGAKCLKCMGIFEYSGVCVLIECDTRQIRSRGPTLLTGYILLCEHPVPPIREKLFVEFLDTKGSPPMRIRSAAIAKTGEIVVVDESGLAFEGNLCDALRTYASGSPQEGVLTVLIDRICGLPPVKEVFISPDGKNKALTVCDLVLDKFNWIKPSVLPKVIGPVKSVKAVCVKEDMSEIASFNTCRNYLMMESDYCAIFFTRWSASAPKTKLIIRFFASSFAVDQFVLFCATHEISSGLTSNQLFELLLFADAYCCDNFFDHVVDQFLTNQFDIMTLRDLYSIARYTKRPRLIEIVNGLCAVFFPILLDRGFVNDLNDEEVKAIELFCKTDECFKYVPAPDMPAAADGKAAISTDERIMEMLMKLAEMRHDKWMKTDYFAAEQRQLREQSLQGSNGETNEKVDSWLQNLSSELQAGGKDYVDELYTALQKRFAKARPIITTRRIQRRSEHEETPEARTTPVANAMQRPSTSKGPTLPPINESPNVIDYAVTPPVSPKPMSDGFVEQVATRMMELMSPLDGNGPSGSRIANGGIYAPVTHFPCLSNGIPPRGPVPPSAIRQDGAPSTVGRDSVPTTPSSVRRESASSAANENDVPDFVPQSSASKYLFQPSSPQKIVGRENDLSQISSPSSSLPSGSPRKIGGWSTTPSKPSSLEHSFREIVENELAESKKKQSSPAHKVSWKKPTITHRYDMNLNICAASPPAVKAAWNVASTDEEQASTSFKDIVENEVAQQSESKRVTTTQVADIETEEHAISELVAVYEADAARNGSSATISVERIQSARSNPLWSARS